MPICNYVCDFPLSVAAGSWELLSVCVLYRFFFNMITTIFPVVIEIYPALKMEHIIDQMIKSTWLTRQSILTTNWYFC